MREFDKTGEINRYTVFKQMEEQGIYDNRAYGKDGVEKELALCEQRAGFAGFKFMKVTQEPGGKNIWVLQSMSTEDRAAFELAVFKGIADRLLRMVDPEQFIVTSAQEFAEMLEKADDKAQAWSIIDYCLELLEQD